MTTIETVRVTPAPTAERVVAAWAAAHPVMRRAVLAACVTSAAISSVIPAPTSVRWSVAAVGVILAIAAMVDVHEYRLPNRLLLGALAAALAGAFAASSVSTLIAAAIGMLLGGGLMMLVHLSRGVGMGDVKMAGVVGVSVGAVEVNAVPVAIAVAAFVAAAYGLAAHRRRLPIGPALWFGWAVALAVCAAGWLS